MKILVQNNFDIGYVLVDGARLPGTAPTRQGAVWCSAIATVGIFVFTALAYVHPPTPRQADPRPGTVAAMAAAQAVGEGALRAQIEMQAEAGSVAQVGAAPAVLDMSMEANAIGQ